MVQKNSTFLLPRHAVGYCSRFYPTNASLLRAPNLPIPQTHQYSSKKRINHNSHLETAVLHQKKQQKTATPPQLSKPDLETLNHVTTVVHLSI